ncbi:MAG: PA2779 family protein [Candidatus Euphemobacter frigidus]|nr:PA2779 family protein [Candidatus Euphemobacter frigidus]MDP8276362.1 PA2779 family protein [Candidatus Euphemobacter frigidus]
MLLNTMLRWPWMTVALFVAGMLCLSSPGSAGLLLSRARGTDTAEPSRIELEKEIITISIEKMGWSREEAEEKLALLSEDEIHHLAVAVEKIMAGGEEDQGARALGVGLVIVIVLAAITGVYLFSQANK